MKILLVLPSTGNWKSIGTNRLFNGKTFRFSMLPLLTVAGITPDRHAITIVDEQVDTLPDDRHFDIVGINTMTATMNRAYEIARLFRAKGSIVVFGGMYATLNPDDVLCHGDAVVMGPAFDAWPQLLVDAERGALREKYHGNPHGKKPPVLPYSLLRGSHYLPVHATYATMGCTNQCSFCSVTAFYKGNRYRRPVSEVAEELAAVRRKIVLFVDDNLTQDRDYCLLLARAVAPLKKKWITQASIDIAYDDGLLDALAASGCVGIFAGLETFSAEALASQNKNIQNPLHYRTAIARLHAHGIFVEAGIVFGFPGDTKQVFAETLRQLNRIGVDAIQPSVLTPQPGTKLHAAMKNRIVDRDLDHYDFKHAVFTPDRMAREDLEEGTKWVVREFYKPSRILRRLVRWLAMPRGLRHIAYPLLLNIAYFGRVLRFGIAGYDPAAQKAAPVSVAPVARDFAGTFIH